MFLLCHQELGADAARLLLTMPLLPCPMFVSPMYLFLTQHTPTSANSSVSAAGTLPHASVTAADGMYNITKCIHSSLSIQTHSHTVA